MAKTRHSGKIEGFTAFDENYGFRAFRDFYCPYTYVAASASS